MRGDQSFWPTLTALADCLADEFAEEGFCFIGILPGATAVADYGNPGMAWVRLVDASPSLTFPQPDQTVGCDKPLAATIEVGELHCFEVPTDGSAPTLEEQLEASQRQLSYMQAMYRAIKCCLNGRGGPEVLLGTYQPRGPQGMLVGGVWTLWIGEAD